MPFEKSDFILIDYVAEVKETNEVFDTTIEEVAKQEKVYKEGEIYEPRLIVLGEGWVLKALEESLFNFNINKKTSVEIPPDKAFGSRDPEKIKIVPLRRLTTKGINPQLGMRVDLGGKFAVVRTMGAGRVQLDFNPPLAGKTLAYTVTVKKRLKSKVEKIAALIHRRIPVVDIAKFKTKVKKTAIEINLPEEAYYIEGLQIAKRGIATDIQKFFPEFLITKFVESFRKKNTVSTATKPTQLAETI